MALKRKSILLIMVFLIGCFVCACGKEDSVAGESLVEDTEEVSSTEKIKNAEEEAAVQLEKGYNLPVDEQEKEEAESDCKKLMELYLDIYETADKGIASNVVLDDQTVLEIQKKVKDAGYPIATMVTYSNMENYESVDSFLKECMEGKRGKGQILRSTPNTAPLICGACNTQPEGLLTTGYYYPRFYMGLPEGEKKELGEVLSCGICFDGRYYAVSGRCTVDRKNFICYDVVTGT